MKSLIAVFWDSFSELERKNQISFLEKYFDTVIESNRCLSDYLNNGSSFYFIEDIDTLFNFTDTEKPNLIFILAELYKEGHLRSSLKGLEFVKNLRNRGIKQPFVLFSFLDVEKHLDYFDKDDFVNADYMQFFVRLPHTLLLSSQSKHEIRSLTDFELDDLVNNQFNKTRKATFLLNKLQEDISNVPDNNLRESNLPIISTLHRIAKWVPDETKKPLYKTVVPNKLIRIHEQARRVSLLENYKNRLIDGINS